MTQTGSRLETEWSLLGVSCSEDLRGQRTERVRQLLQSPIQWKTLLSLADQHGLQPLLYQTLSKVADAVSSAEMCSLQQAYELNLHKSLFLARELIRIIDHLRSTGVDVLPYKGPALAEMYYGDIALRPSGDIDLLTLQADLPRIREAVKQLGYIPHWSLTPGQERAFLRAGYECAFDGPSGPNLLELQWALQPRFYSVDFDMGGLFSRAVVTSVAGYEVKTPSVEDQLLILSLHASKHVWGRLIWLSDIARVMNTPKLDWGWIGLQAVDLGIVRILRVTAVLAERLLGKPVPVGLNERLPMDPFAEMLAQEIEARIRQNAGYDVESVEYFRLMLRLRERQIDRLRFVSRLAFTPGPSEWKAVRLPQRLSPLYRLVRLSRLTAKMIRR